MLAVRAEQRDIESFKHDSQALVTDFFQAMAQDLPPHLADTAMKIADAFLTKHMRARLGSLFKLKHAAALKVVLETGGDEGWLATIEENAGFSFERSDIPPSSALVHPSKRSNVEAEAEAEWGAKSRRTVSQKLAHEKVLTTEVLPTSVYSLIETPDFTVNTIKEKELQDTLDEVLVYILEKHHSVRLGRPLANVYAKQITNHLTRLPPYGKKPGHERDVAQMLIDKARNRLYVRRAI